MRRRDDTDSDLELSAEDSLSDMQPALSTVKKEPLDEDELQLYRAFLQQTLSNLIFYPVQHVKILCQLGHEPIPPRAVRTIFGKTRLMLPNVFRYIKHIQSTEGFFGLFNGLMPTVVGSLTSAALTMKVVRALQLKWVTDVDPPNIINDDEPNPDEYMKYAKKELTIHTISLILEYPFKVISIRMIASYVGGEEGYQSMFQTIGSIIREDGFSGFFKGLVPRIIGDVACIGASICMTYYINKYLVKSKDSRGYVAPVCLFTTSSITYPFMVVSTCMTVNGTSMAAGNPPRMPYYPTWKTCLSDLITRRQHKRGGSLIFRYQN